MVYRIKSKIILCIFSMFISVNSVARPVDWQQPEWAPLSYFYQIENNTHAQVQVPHLVLLDRATLPPPFDYLFNQPLMTIAIAEHYQRAPKVRTPIYAHLNTHHRYSRAIVMIVDNNKQRNDALLADPLGESTIVELGLIDINFKALPQPVIDGILQGTVPFGALLVKNHIKTRSVHKHYFKITCDTVLSKHLQCTLGDTLYGRTNLLVREDNNEWAARAVEVLKNNKQFVP